MALSDPELDLLRELLTEDPTDEVFLQVGKELFRRSEFEEAANVLAVGMEASPEQSEGWVLLARAAHAVGELPLTLRALSAKGVDVDGDPMLAAMEVTALESLGRQNDAIERVKHHLKRYPDVLPLKQCLERLTAWVPATRRNVRAPLHSPARAECYVSLGRVDRAIRVYRQLVHHDPHDAVLKDRLAELVALTGQESAQGELAGATAGRVVADQVAKRVGQPRRTSENDVTEVPVGTRQVGPNGPVNESAPGKKRKRRSLLRR